MSDFKFAEIAIGSKANRGKTYPCNSILDLDCFEKDYSETFSSVFVHSHEFVDYHDADGGKKGYAGKVKTDFIPFDFDYEPNQEKAFHEVVQLINYLLSEYQVYPEQLRLFFSGNKGFHLLLVSPEMARLSEEKIFDIPTLTKAIALKVADQFTTMDKVIYDTTRLFRLPNTKHGVTGLYKIPITANIEFIKIKELAKNKIKCEFLPITEFSENKYILKLIESCSKISSELINKSQWHYTGNQLIDGIINGFPQGERNKGLFSLGRVFFSRGIDIDVITPILQMVNSHNKMGLLENEVAAIARSCSKYPVIQESREPLTKDILTMKDAYGLWKIQHSKTNETDFGYKLLNNSCRCFSDGEVFYIAARGGTGKTTLIMHIVKNIAKSTGAYGLLFSLEMQAARLFYRAGVIDVSEKNIDGCSIDAANFCLSNENEAMAIAEKWKSLLIVDKDGLIIEQVEKYIVIAREMRPSLSVIGIDYLGYLKDTRSGSTYEQVSRIAKEVKGLSKRQNIRIVVACQTSREGEDGTVPVRLNHMRDSGAIEESADYVLGMWKDATNDKKLHCKILKCRNAEDGLEFDFNKQGLFYMDVPAEIKQPKKPKTGM